MAKQHNTPPPPPRPSCICVPPIYMYIQCLSPPCLCNVCPPLPAGADLAQTVLTKCVRTEGNIRSETFQLQLDFGFLQDMQDARKVKEKRSLFAAVRSASTNLLDPRERCHVYYTVCVHVLYVYMYCMCMCTCTVCVHVLYVYMYCMCMCTCTVCVYVHVLYVYVYCMCICTVCVCVHVLYVYVYCMCICTVCVCVHVLYVYVYICTVHVCACMCTVLSCILNLEFVIEKDFVTLCENAIKSYTHIHVHVAHVLL